MHLYKNYNKNNKFKFKKPNKLLRVHYRKM